MKLYIYIIISAVLLFSSCNDFLDKYPENTVDIQEVDYTKTEDMFKPAAGMYARIRSNNGFGSWSAYGLIAVRGDDIDKGSSPADQGDLTNAENFNYSQLGGYWALNGTWQGLYNLVLNSNAALIALDEYNKYTTTDSEKKLNVQYHAEIRFMRAYAYFYLARLFGDIPLVLANEEVLNNSVKTPRLDIYKFINDEVEFCVANLPALRPNEMTYKGQVTMYTALALKAKANSDINDWDAVLSATDEIINSGKFSLYSSFYDYFKLPGCLSNENLFELQYGVIDGTVFASDAWFEFQGPRNGFVGDKIGGGWGFLTPSPKFEALFKARGESDRFETTFLFAGTTTREGDVLKPSIAPEGYDRVFNGKTYLPSTQLPVGKTTYGLGNNIRMLRYADVLLLNAEAKVRKGQNGDTPFNEVRTRAKMTNLTNVTLDQILEERSIELAGEWGERFYDLVRTGKAEGTLNGFVAGKSEFYPVPQAQIDLNPNLR